MVHGVKPACALRKQHDKTQIRPTLYQTKRQSVAVKWRLHDLSKAVHRSPVKLLQEKLALYGGAITELAKFLILLFFGYPFLLQLHQIKQQHSNTAGLTGIP